MLSVSLIYILFYLSLPSTWRKHVCIDLLSYSVRSFGELSSSRFVIGLFYYYRHVQRLKVRTLDA